MPREDAPCFAPRVSHRRRAESGCSSTSLHHIPATNPLKKQNFPSPAAEPGATLFLAQASAGIWRWPRGCEHPLRRQSRSRAHGGGHPRPARCGQLPVFHPPGRGGHPYPCGLNELPDFRLNEQAAGMMTKLPYCKKRPKFKMLWPNVAPSGKSANTPCIGFL